MNKSEITAGSVFSQLESSMIGDGTYGECHIRRYTRFKTPVVEKRLKESDLTEVKKEACYIQLFSHLTCASLDWSTNTNETLFSHCGVSWR